MYKRAIEENSQRREEVRRTATPGEVRINEPAFAGTEEMWKNAIMEAEAKYKEYAVTLKKTISQDYRVLSDNRGKMPPGYWETRPAIESVELDTSKYIVTSSGVVITPAGFVITPGQHETLAKNRKPMVSLQNKGT